MKIRSKLAWTFIILLIIGINSICSYAIIYIKGYVSQHGVQELREDTHLLAVAISNLPSSTQIQKHFDEVAESFGYQLALYDSAGALMYSYSNEIEASKRLTTEIKHKLRMNNALAWMAPDNEHADKLVSYSYLPQSINNVRYLYVSQPKSHIYAPVTKIRWSIYYGIFASVILSIIVSIWVARYLTKPIMKIKDTAQKIAGGDVDEQIDVNRTDEFGELADSLNKMAAKLRQDTAQIKRYAERQRQFFADITHEIRNPLHTISASLEMLELEGLPDERRKKYYKNARDQIQRISRLFKDLKTLQQYDSDEYFIEKRTFDLAKTSRHMHEWYAEKAQLKGLDLSVNSHPCFVIGDPDKIEQVIDNLISNAIKYTHAGSVSLRYFKEQKNIIIEVSDTGIGISKKHLERLFDRFYRADKARSREKGGTGLGLAVVRSILRAHDTDIAVESEPEKGSVFRFWLPAS